MKLEVFEESLAKYLDIYINEMIEVTNGLKARDYIFDENQKKIISDQILDEISENDTTDLTNALKALLSLDQVVFIEQIKNLVDENTLNDVRKELGAYDKSKEDIFNQVKILYQSRILIMLISKFSIYFNKSQYDIFLSHSSIDAREVMGLKLLLLYEHNITTYVDWLDDYELNYLRATQKIISIFLEHLSQEEKELLKNLEQSFEIHNLNREYSSEEITKKILDALNNADNFFYVDSKNSRFSKWMPFELGYAEAQLGKPIFRIIIHYKRIRKGSLKYSSFLNDLVIINDIDKDINQLKLRDPISI